MLTFDDYYDITQLKARYFRYIDTKQWERLRELFTEDATFDGLWAPIANRDEFIAASSELIGPGTFTAHHGFMPEIVGTSESTARGTWSMQDYIVWDSEPTVTLRGMAPGQRGLRGFCRYEDEYRKTDAGWRFSRYRVVRLHVIPITGDQAPQGDYPALTPDWMESVDS